jgi:hypothetical protein
MTAMKKTRYLMDGEGAYLDDEMSQFFHTLHEKTTLSGYPALLPEDLGLAHPALDCELRLH